MPEALPLTYLAARSWNPQEEILKNRIADWKRYKTLGFATELVSSAFSLGLESQVADVALFLLGDPTNVPEPALRIARAVLGADQGVIYTAHVPLAIPSNRESIHALRTGLRDYPRDPFKWIDLARRYAGVGLPKKAEQAILAGLSLAPTSRPILRAAARFFVHTHDPERAFLMLRKATSIRNDPWLVAAEIAVSDVAHKTSGLIKLGRSMLGNNSFKPAEISELASAIGSLELSAGNIRGARKLFERALLEPNDNSVAQAEWASRKIKDFGVPPEHLSKPLNFEARAIQYYTLGEWLTALEETEKWQSDEPFSSRPPSLGTFIAAVVLDDHDKGVQIGQQGLIANPSDSVLLNNLAFSLASLCRVTEAEVVFSKIHPRSCDLELQIALSATAGLIKFRKGLVEEGRSKYRHAIELARGSMNKFQRLLAASFLLREEVRIDSKEVEATLDFIVRESKGHNPKDLIVIDMLTHRFIPTGVGAGR